MKLLNDNKALLNKVHVLRLIVYACFFALACQLWRLQIIHGSQYHQLAERNRVRVMPIAAPRGNITDREGRPLVSNRPAKNIVLIRENLKDLEFTLEFLEKELHLDRESTLARIHKFEKS